MKSTVPTVSVVMPNYNGSSYIHKAIDSILQQTYTDFEFIIIDDGSADDSRDIISSYAEKDSRIVAIKNKENLKICKTLNKGIGLARGKYIARMDSDDISKVDRFSKQVAFMEENPDVGIVGGAMEIMNEEGTVMTERHYNEDDKSIREKIFRYSPFCHPVVMIRAETLQKSGLYDNDLVYSEDYDLYFRLGMHAKFANISNVLLSYRMFPGNSTTKKLKKMEEGTIYIRKKAVREYGYTMSLGDKIYNIIHYISIYIVPGTVKIRLFNLLRNTK